MTNGDVIKECFGKSGFLKRPALDCIESYRKSDPKMFQPTRTPLVNFGVKSKGEDAVPVAPVAEAKK